MRKEKRESISLAVSLPSAFHPLLHDLERISSSPFERGKVSLAYLSLNEQAIRLLLTASGQVGSYESFTNFWTAFSKEKALFFYTVFFTLKVHKQIIKAWWNT